MTRSGRTICRLALIMAFVTSAHPGLTQAPAPLKTSPAQRTELERSYYIVCMNLIQREWEAGHMGRVKELLEETRDSPFRGFEWGYWNHRCSEGATLVSNVGGGINEMHLSRDGKRLLTLSLADKTADVRDVRNGRILRSYGPFHMSLTTAAWSPDEKRLVVICNYEVIVLNAESGERLFSFSNHMGAIKAAFAPDGARIAVAGLTAGVKLYDAETGKEALDPKPHPPGSFYSIAYSADGTSFASGNDIEFLGYVWDAKTGARKLELKGHSQAIGQLAFSPDNKRILTGSWDKSARIWDAETGNLLQTLSGHAAPVTAVNFSADSRLAVTADKDGTALLWDASGKLIRECKGHIGRINAASFSPDGQWLYTAGADGCLKRWDLTPAGEPRRPLDQSVVSELSPRFPEMHLDDYYRYDQIKKGKLPFLLLGVGVNPETRSARRDGKRVVRAFGNTAEVWDVSEGNRLLVLDSFANAVACVTYSEDGKRIATGSEDGTARLWDAETGRLLHTLSNHVGRVGTIAFLANDTKLVTGSSDRTARIWDVRTGRELRVLAGHNGDVFGLEAFNNGKHLVTASKDRDARIWNVETGALIGTLAGHAYDGGITLSSTAERAFTGNLTPGLWDIRTGQRILSLPERGVWIYRSAFSSDGRRVAVGGPDGDLHIYDTGKGQETLGITLPGNNVWIWRTCFSRNGSALLTVNARKPESCWLFETSLPDAKQNLVK